MAGHEATSGQTWNTWVGTYTSSATANTNYYVWENWTSGTCSATTSALQIGNETWKVWAGSPYIINGVVETEEERIARIETQRAFDEVIKKQNEEREKERREAEEKALELLLENLEENQVEIFKKTGCFVVTGKSGKKYRINDRGVSGNVEELDGDKVKARLCFHPNNSYVIPKQDSYLAQKLMLEFNEEEALRTANRTVLQ